MVLRRYVNGNMGIIIAVAKLSSSHPALLAWTSALLHRTAMHDNRLVVVTQKYTTRLESKRGRRCFVGGKAAAEPAGFEMFCGRTTATVGITPGWR